MGKNNKLWHGVPRESIPWYPTIDEDKCINCTLCYVSCGKLVFDMDEVKRKAIVKNPYNCMVGCSTCATVCITEAITFPKREMIQRIEREHKIFRIVKKEAKSKQTKVELEKARKKAEKLVSNISNQIEFEITGQFGEKRFLIKLYDFVKDKDCDITELKLENPTLKGTMEKMTPSFMKFKLVSETYDDVENYSKELHKLLEENNLHLINERNV